MLSSLMMAFPDILFCLPSFDQAGSCASHAKPFSGFFKKSPTTRCGLQEGMLGSSPPPPIENQPACPFSCLFYPQFQVQAFMLQGLYLFDLTPWSLPASVLTLVSHKAFTDFQVVPVLQSRGVPWIVSSSMTWLLIPNSITPSLTLPRPLSLNY